MAIKKKGSKVRPNKTNNAKPAGDAVKSLNNNKESVAAMMDENAVKIPKKRGPHGPRKPKDTGAAANIHVGEIISKRMKMNNLSKNKLAKILELTPPTVSLMVNSNSVQTERLMEVSFVLKHNFFLEIGQLLQLSEAGIKAMESATMNAPMGAFSDVDYELKFLREENTYLKKIVELLAGARS